MNPIDRSAIIIANKPFRFATRAYQPGDRFTYKTLVHAQRRKVVRLIEGPERKLVELTPETFKTAMKRRENKVRPPRGFTIAGLLGLGIITTDQVVEYGWSNIDVDRESVGDENWVPTVEGSWRVFSEGTTEEQSTDDNTLWIVPLKSRGAPRYHVHDVDGTKLTGDATINGKANAEAWAREYMVERAKRRDAAAETEGQMPDWSGFDADPEKWTDDQVEVFSKWFDSLPDDTGKPPEEVTVYELPEGVALAFKDRRDFAASEAARLAKKDEKALFEGMNKDEALEFVAGMDDDALRAFLAAAQGKEVKDLEGLTRVALDDIAVDLVEEKVVTSTEGANDGSNLQPGADEQPG